MQAIEKQFRDELTNFEPPREPSALEFSFIMDSHLTQPMIIYQAGPTRGFSRLRRVILPRDIEGELAVYVERMAGTEFDLDAALETASIERLVSTDDE